MAGNEGNKLHDQPLGLPIIQEMMGQQPDRLAGIGGSVPLRGELSGSRDVMPGYVG